MLIKKATNVVAVLLLMMSLNACKKHYNQGFADGELAGYNNGYGDGQTDGYDSGHSDGYDQGWAEGEAYFMAHQTYEQGFADGYAEFINIGYNNGYSAGFSDGLVVRYDEGYDDGHADGEVVGYNNGYDDGDADGYQYGYNNGYDDGFDDTYQPNYNNGYNDGYSDGYNADHTADLQNAYNQGYSDGDYDGYNDGYDDGYFDSYDEGYNNGFFDGESNGFYAGYNTGYDDGFDDGFDIGFDDGYDWGYDDGYDDGYYDGSGGFSGTSTVAIADKSGLPHNNAANLNPHIAFAANVHRDIIDFDKYKKIEQEYEKGLKASLFEETSASSKDLAKLATLKENFRINLAAKDISEKFKLSKERAVELATLSTTWRKLANTRAITETDADKFGQKLIGMNLTKLFDAVKESRQGNLTAMDTVLENAAKANKVDKVHMSKIILHVFF